MNTEKFIKILLFVAFLPVALPLRLIEKLIIVSFGLLFDFKNTVNRPLMRDRPDGLFQWNGKLW